MNVKSWVLLPILAAVTLVLAGCNGDTLQNEFAATLTHEAEVPAPTLNGADPSGSATATLNDEENTLTITGSFEGLTGPATAAHIHGPAEVGEAAGVVFPLNVDEQTDGNLSGTWDDITAQEVEQLRDGMFYVNVHTDQNGPGEIRGQLD